MRTPHLLNLLPTGEWLFSGRPAADPAVLDWVAQLWEVAFGHGPANLMAQTTPEQADILRRWLSMALPEARHRSDSGEAPDGASRPEATEAPKNSGSAPSKKRLPTIYLNEDAMRVGGQAIQPLPHMREVLERLADDPERRDMDGLTILKWLGQIGDVSQRDIAVTGREGLQVGLDPRQARAFARRMERWNERLGGKYFVKEKGEFAWRFAGSVKVASASPAERKAERESLKQLPSKPCVCASCDEPFESYLCEDCGARVEDRCPECHAEIVDDRVA